MSKEKDKKLTKPTKSCRVQQDLRRGRKPVADGIAWDRVDLVLRKMEKAARKQLARTTELRKRLGL